MQFLKLFCIIWTRFKILCIDLQYQMDYFNKIIYFYCKKNANWVKSSYNNVVLSQHVMFMHFIYSRYYNCSFLIYLDPQVLCAYSIYIYTLLYVLSTVCILYIKRGVVFMNRMSGFFILYSDSHLFKDFSTSFQLCKGPWKGLAFPLHWLCSIIQ